MPRAILRYLPVLSGIRGSGSTIGYQGSFERAALHSATAQRLERSGMLGPRGALAGDEANGVFRTMRAFLADTLALLAFFTLTGILNERFVAGMDWSEVSVARAIGAPLMIVTARPYGLWRDALLRRFAGAARSGQLVWDVIALMSFQVPLYAAVIWAGGAESVQILHGTLGAAVIMLAAGWPYGLWLDWVRGRFGLPRGGNRPMSLQEQGRFTPRAPGRCPRR